MADGTPQTQPGPTLPYNSYIGGSRIAAVAGLSLYRTPLDVWAEMRGILDPQPQSPEAEVGTELERPAIERIYARRRGVSVSFPGTMRDANEVWIGATPDAITSDAIDVQCKFVGLRQSRRWGPIEDGADAIPPEYYAQVTWEMGVAGLERAHVFAVLGTDARIYEVALDVEYLDLLREIARPFWHDCVVGGAMPGSGSVGRQTIEAMYPRAVRGMLPSTTDGERLARRYERLRRALDRIEKMRDDVANELRLEIGDAEGIEGSWGRARWAMRKGSPRWKEIAAELGAEARPELVAKHTGQPTRALDVRMKGA